MISGIRGARQLHPLSMNAGSTLLQRRTVEMLVRRCTEPDMSGSSKASQFWDADAPFASASLVEMQKSPGLEGPLDLILRCSYVSHVVVGKSDPQCRSHCNAINLTVHCAIYASEWGFCCTRVNNRRSFSSLMIGGLVSGVL